MNTLLQFFPVLMGAPPADAASGGGGGQLVTTFITFGLVIAIFYFLIIRPQNKKQKETKRMLEAIKKGDRVATIGGIRGTVVSVREDTVVLKVDSQTKMEFSKSAVSQVLAVEEKRKKKTEESAEVEAEAEDEEPVEAEDGEEDSEE